MSPKRHWAFPGPSVAPNCSVQLNWGWWLWRTLVPQLSGPLCSCCTLGSCSCPVPAGLEETAKGVSNSHNKNFLSIFFSFALVFPIYHEWYEILISILENMILVLLNNFTLPRRFFRGTERVCIFLYSTGTFEGREAFLTEQEGR